MARYDVFPESDNILQLIERLCCHHDHLKTLHDCYTFMRQKQTYERMRDTNFRCDPVKMKELDSSYFTSLIIKLSIEDGQVFFTEVKRAYKELEYLLKRFDPEANVEIYFDSAHITIKSLHDGLKQDKAALKRYLSVITPIVRKWIDLMGRETSLYAVGLVTNLHKEKGLGIGVKFYPSHPLIQIMRGEVGAALYAENDGIPLRPEASFHTMLTHSIGFRARNLCFPMSMDFIHEFQATVEKFDQTVFGAIRDIQIEDVYVRNGFSDKLVTIAEVCASEGC